jgi:ATP-binding cassette subfamily B protein
MFWLGGSITNPLFIIKLGDMAAFVQYARKFAGPINEFANIFSELQSALSAAERVFGVIDQAPEPADKPDAVSLDTRGQVTLENVEFGYVQGKQILHGLSVKVEPGQTVAIVGPTGAGKTTIINLLMRFYDIDAGEIRFDGIPITDATRDSLRRSFTMVLQDTWLFGGSVRDNIAYGRQDATDEEIVEAAKKAKIHHFIMSLPQGYATHLADGGVNLSKGQRQLITIARAMLSHAPMLILDEATSNVDSRTEHQIQDAMMELMRGKTCFVIAHRLSTVQHADKILVLKDGNIIESGTHEQLLCAKGFYASLYGAQFVN